MRIRRIPFIALFSAITLVVGVVLVTLPAAISAAASGVLSSVTQSVVNDGTAPFDSSAGDGFDANATNGIVRTRDSFDIDWNYVVSSAGDVTFTETLVNGRWDSSSAGACSQGVGAISADKKTLTCTLTNLSVGSGSYRVRAFADGAAANGASITGVVSAGSAQSTSLALTVSATPKLNIGTMDLFPVVSNGPGAYSGITGYYFDVPIAMWTDVNGTFDGVSGLRGIEALTSPMTFSAVPSSADALLMSCSAGAAGGTRPTFPDAAGGNGTTVVNAVKNAGAWTCAQTAPGATVTVTVTGADTSLNSYPTKSANNSPITSNRAYVADGYIRLWVPKTSTTPNATTIFTTRITNFDPTSASGVSNYLTNAAPNQPNPAVCVPGAYANCSAVTVNRVPQAVRPDVRLENASMGNLPGSSVAWDGLGQVTANTKFYASMLSSVPVANDTMTDITLCMKWDPTKSTIDQSKPILSASGGLPASIEYGTSGYTSLLSYQAGDCGRPGTGSGWFSSISAAGGASSVTAVRVTFSGVLNSGASLTVDVPQIAQPGQVAGSYIGYFASLSSVETVALASTYEPSSATGSSGTRAQYLDARTSVSIVWDSETSTTPAVREVTVSPQLLAGETAQNTIVNVTLPSACFEYVVGSASISPSNIIPANRGPDGLACTSDDVSSAKLQFSFGSITSTPEPITFRVNIAPAISVPSNQTVSATIESTSDPASSTLHSTSATLAVSAVAGFSLAKTADVGRVTEGSAFNYTINWRNGSAAQSGGVKIVDVLPFAGDARGSSGFAQLTVNSVSVPSGTEVQYSALDAATAMALVDTHPDGEHSSFAWTIDKPAHVTAVRLVVTHLAPLTAGSSTVNVSATGIQAGGKVKNDLYGVASFASAPIRAAVPIEIQTLGTASLALTKTANVSEISAAGQNLRYTIHVTNTGQEALSSVTVTDHSFTGTGASPSVTCPSMVLAAGASMDCFTSSYTTTQTDLDTRTTISNEATATAAPPAGALVSASDSVSTPVRASSSLTLTQIPSPNNLTHVGSTVTYTFTATNSGTRTLTDLSITPGGFNGSGSPTPATCSATSIAPNSSVTCTSTYSVSQQDLDTLSALVNPANASATDSAQSTVNSNRTRTTVPLLRQPAVALSKSSSVASFDSVGSHVSFVFTVTNIGNVTVDGVGVDETSFSGSGDLGEISCPLTTIAPNASTTCTADYVVTQADFNAGFIVNKAKAYASFTESTVSSTESSVRVNAVGIVPGLTIATTADVEFVSDATELINYSIVVTNTGNVSLSQAIPIIAVGGFNGSGVLSSAPISCPTTVLSPLASMTCTMQYDVQQADIDTLNWIDLETSVSANAPGGTVSATAAQVSVEVLPIAHLDVAATPSMSATTRAGDTIVFTLVLFNDGGFTLENVMAEVDSGNFNGSGTLGQVICPQSLTLAPGEQGLCEVTYTVTQADIDELPSLQLSADAVANYDEIETFSTGPSREQNDLAEVQITPLESLSLVKTASLVMLSEENNRISYEFEVTNLGTRTLHNVAVDELEFNGASNLGTVSCPDSLVRMSPGSTELCQAVYFVAAADFQQSRLVNTAIARGAVADTLSSRKLTSLHSTATVAVKTAEKFESDSGGDKLTLTGAKQLTQLLAAAFALMLGVVALTGSRVRRKA